MNGSRCLCVNVCDEVYLHFCGFFNRRNAIRLSYNNNYCHETEFRIILCQLLDRIRNIHRYSVEIGVRVFFVFTYLFSYIFKRSTGILK